VHKLVNSLMDEGFEALRAEVPIERVTSYRGVSRPMKNVVARKPRRVYLVPPARWKSARLAMQPAGVEWSTVLPAPSSWPNARARPSPVWKPVLTGAKFLVISAAVVSHARKLRAAVLVALRRMELAKTLVILGDRALRRSRSAWGRTNQRRAIAAFAFCAVLGLVAIPLFTGVAHSQPELDIQATTFAPATPQAVMKNLAAAVVMTAPKTHVEGGAAIESSPSSPAAEYASTSSSSIAPLSDVSTMDLMMPIAEPDLNIASSASLWSQVGKQFGVDPLLLYSIALVESRSLHPAGDIGPTPWLFRVNDHLVLGERHHVQMEMAVASQLNANVQDVGIMQVYYPMHRDAVRDPLSLLDPRTNISVAAKILHEGMHETRDPVLGVGYYHSHTPQLAREYGTVVMAVYQRLKGVYRTGRHAQIVAR
jgi:hypothetical protein